MSRSLPEWIGSTDNTPAPDRVRLRVFIKYHGRCPMCSRPLQPGRWQCDHVQALINGGENRERNLQPLCDEPCHRIKTGEDVAQKSKTYTIASAHTGAKRKQRSITGWRKFNGTRVYAPRQR